MNKKRPDFAKVLGNAIAMKPEVREVREVKDNQVGHENAKALEKLKTYIKACPFQNTVDIA